MGLTRIYDSENNTDASSFTFAGATVADGFIVAVIAAQSDTTAPTSSEVTAATLAGASAQSLNGVDVPDWFDFGNHASGIYFAVWEYSGGNTAEDIFIDFGSHTQISCRLTLYHTTDPYDVDPAWFDSTYEYVSSGLSLTTDVDGDELAVLALEREDYGVPTWVNATGDVNENTDDFGERIGYNNAISAGTTVSCDPGSWAARTMAGVVFVEGAGGPLTAPVGLATEADTALAPLPSLAAPAGIAIEADIALAPAPAQGLPVGLSAEADQALPLDAALAAPVGMASEIDTAFALSLYTPPVVGLAEETDTALPLSPVLSESAGLAAEADTALALTGKQIVPYGQIGRLSSEEFVFPFLWNPPSGLVQGVDFDVWGEHNGTPDGAELHVSLPETATPSGAGVFGFPIFGWGNPNGGEGMAVTPKQLSAVTSLWNYVDLRYTGTGNFTGLFEAMLTSSPGAGQDKKLEVGVWLRPGNVTAKQYAYLYTGYEYLGHITDAWGQVWRCHFLPGEGSSETGYVIWFPADFEDRLVAQFDYVAMAKFAIAAIYALDPVTYANVTESLWLTGLMTGPEPLVNPGLNVLKRHTWLRDWDNSSYVDLGDASHNIIPNSGMDGAYAWGELWSGKSIADGVYYFDAVPQYYPGPILVPSDVAQVYRITGTAVSLTEGSFRFQFSDTEATAEISSAGDFDMLLTAPADDATLVISPRGAGTNTFVLDNVKATPVQTTGGPVGLATETDSALAPTAVLKAAPGIAAETDTALAPDAVQQVAAGLAVEADAALPIGAVLVAPVGLASEADTAFALSPNVPGIVGLAHETDTAMPLTARVAAAAGVASETDAALAPGAALQGAAGLAVETDGALPIGAVISAPAGQASEADTAFALAPNVAAAVGLALETDTALPLTARVAAAAGLASETDAAMAPGAALQGAAGRAEETDAALPVGAVISAPVGMASESDSAFALTPNVPGIVGLALETDTALPLTARVAATPGLATETDAALAPGAALQGAVGQAVETNGALPIGAVLAAPVGVASEADTAFALVPNIPGTVGLALETDTAFPLVATLAVPAGIAIEADSALAPAPVVGLPAGQALETDLALPLAAVLAAPVGQADETDAALSLAPVVSAPVGLAVEADVALPQAGKLSAPAGLAIEADTALAPAPAQALPAGLAVETDLALALSATLGPLMLPGEAIDVSLSVTEIDVRVEVHRIDVRLSATPTDIG